MQKTFPIGNFVNLDPLMVEVDYNMPYNQAINFLKVQHAHEHDMRGSYVIDRGKVRGKGRRLIPIWIFMTTFPSVSRGQFNIICNNVMKRPITFIELLALARKYSMMDFYKPDQETITIALGSNYDSTYRDAPVKVNASLTEFPDSMRKQGSRMNIGMAFCNDGVGKGVFLPVTNRDPL